MSLFFFLFHFQWLKVSLENSNEKKKKTKRNKKKKLNKKNKALFLVICWEENIIGKNSVIKKTKEASSPVYKINLNISLENADTHQDYYDFIRSGLSWSLEFLMCELWIIPKRGVNILAKDFVMLYGGRVSSNPRNNWS